MFRLDGWCVVFFCTEKYLFKAAEVDGRVFACFHGAEAEHPAPNLPPSVGVVLSSSQELEDLEGVREGVYIPRGVEKVYKKVAGGYKELTEAARGGAQAFYVPTFSAHFGVLADATVTSKGLPSSRDHAVSAVGLTVGTAFPLSSDNGMIARHVSELIQGNSRLLLVEQIKKPPGKKPAAPLPFAPL